MKERIKYWLDDPQTQAILFDVRVTVVAIVFSGVVVGIINGIYALCEWLKNLSI